MKLTVIQVCSVSTLSAEALAGWKAAAETVERAGAVVVDVDLSSLKYSLPAYYVISAAEAASNLSRYDGVRYGPGDRLGESAHFEGE